ncbi:ATP-binding protein [uncultured Reyranella sp.]|jgi:ATP-dependent DNA helicase RecG|uniref:ATP-binding protein n=1 Tax=uncultured Reyranella sp. TaxID=735512 RepID=UPI00259CCFF7|nr:ATP-binding protein [uncultured Reyranella sp.]
MDVREISSEEVEVILSYEESHFRDVKAIDIQPAKLSQTISAFANTAGGEIFVGLDEVDKSDGTTVRSWRGFQDQESANGLIQAIEGLSPLGNFYRAQFLKCAGQIGYVLHLIIFKTREIMNATSGTPYVRRGAQKLPVSTPEALARLQLDKGITTFEDNTLAVPLDIVTNSVTVLEFLISEVPTAEPETWLRSQMLLATDKPTVAAVLLYADVPQAALPKRSSIKVFRYRTREEGLDRETLAFDPLTIEGPIYDVIEKAVTHTKEIVESIKKIGESGMEEISYPDETLHEIITNAVLHRDYSIATDIQIRIYDDRVEVESPGRLPGHVTVDNVLNEQFARNPKLVRLINKFPDPPNKDVGEGLNTAFAAMRRIRLKEPQVQESDNSVIVHIRHERLSSPAQIVLEYLDANDTITNQIGREITGLRRDVQMKDVFVALRKQKLIEQVPGKRGRASAWRKA